MIANGNRATCTAGLTVKDKLRAHLRKKSKSLEMPSSLPISQESMGNWGGVGHFLPNSISTTQIW